MKGPGDFTPDDPDDRIANRAEELEREIAGDDARVKAIDVELSEQLEASQYEELFSVMADLHAIDPDKLPGNPILPRLYKLSRPIAAMREAAIVQAAQDQAETESLEWPAWRGTESATRHAGQMEYRRMVAGEDGDE